MDLLFIDSMIAFRIVDVHTHVQAARLVSTKKAGALLAASRGALWSASECDSACEYLYGAPKCLTPALWSTSACDSRYARRVFSDTWSEESRRLGITLHYKEEGARA